MGHMKFVPNRCNQKIGSGTMFREFAAPPGPGLSYSRATLSEKALRGCNLDVYKILIFFKGRNLVILRVWAAPGAPERKSTSGPPPAPGPTRCVCIFRLRKLDSYERSASYRGAARVLPSAVGGPREETLIVIRAVAHKEGQGPSPTVASAKR